MKTELKKAFIMFLMVAAFSSLALAEVAATVDVDYTNFEAWVGAENAIDDGERAIGWRFFVDQEITITHLGIFDNGEDGLATTHTVGLWRVNAYPPGGIELLRQADIGPGVTTVANHVYVDIEDITLSPEQDPDPNPDYRERYLVGIWSPLDNSDALLIKPREAATVDAEVDGFITIQDYTYRNYQGVNPLPYYYPAPWGETNDWEFHFGVNFKFTTNVTPNIMALIDIVEEMNLQQGIDNSLDAKLDSALNALDDVNENNDVAAINSLQAFINAVEAQRDNKLTDAQADGLVEEAQKIINLLIP